MNEVLLNYVKTCRESGYTDAEIVEQLTQVGWSSFDIQKCVADTTSISDIVMKQADVAVQNQEPIVEPLREAKPKFKLPAIKFPKFQFPKVKKNPLGMLKGKLSGLQLKNLKPNFAFIFKKKQQPSQLAEQVVTETTTTAPENNQVVMGPDGHKYYVYFYPVPAQLEAQVPLTNNTSAMPQMMPGNQPYYIPMPGAPNQGMPAYPYAPYPMYGAYPIYPGQPQMANMPYMPNYQGYQALPGSPAFNEPVKKKRKDSKFWNAVDIARRVTIIVALLLVVGYVANYFIQLRKEAAAFNANADSETQANFEALKQKFEEFYQKNKKLPSTLKEIDSKAELSTNVQSGQVYDYKIISSTNFHLCTVFNAGSSTYQKGYVCQPYEVNTLGMISAGLPINPGDGSGNLPATGTQKEYPGCSNPKPLLSTNVKCDANDHTNCRHPQHKQEFGMSSVVLSNVKDRIAQTFKLPASGGATMFTQFSPFIIETTGTGNACMAIYETEFDNEPLSGRVIAEYQIPLKTLEAQSYNNLFVNPVVMQSGKTYSLVFSMMDENGSVTFARGMELSSYNDGNAYYLKRSLEVCTKNCEPEIWVDRQDDLKFNLRFY